ncbi:AraC family ligand binding domain-containing protein [Novosphingobium sp. MW5]|nr:AraC family ligand binding domain-containing protein [Novosphingobium sp. MW5]
MHRHARLHQLLLLQSGGGTATLDGQRHALPPGSLVNVPVGVVHGFSFTPETHGFVVTFAAEMLDQSLQTGEGLREILAETGDPDGVQADIPPTMAAIFSACRAGAILPAAPILRSLAGLLLGQTARALLSGARWPVPTPARHCSPGSESLIDAQYLRHWGVADYAKALSVSAAHLSRVTRAATGRPASVLIEDRLIREARPQPRVHELARIARRLRAGIRRPGLFHPRLRPCHRPPLAARLSSTPRRHRLSARSSVPKYPRGGEFGVGRRGGRKAPLLYRLWSPAALRDPARHDHPALNASLPCCRSCAAIAVRWRQRASPRKPAPRCAPSTAISTPCGHRAR